MIISKKYTLVAGCYRVTVNRGGENVPTYVHVIDGNSYLGFSLSFWHAANERRHGRTYPVGCYDTFDEVFDAYIQEIVDFYR